MNKKGLGRGLQALISTPAQDNVQTEGVKEIDVQLIKQNEKQPRKDFDQAKLEELAASIKEHGVIQPIIVRPLPDGKYEIVAGERRWRASLLLGVQKIPAIIREFDERELAEIALIENIQREDLNPIEEAMAYKRLIEEFKITQDDLSKRVGKSRPFIANAIRLLNLHPAVQEFVAKGIVSVGHARALLAVPDGQTQLLLAEKIIKSNLTVRDIENYLKKRQEKDRGAKKEKEQIPPIILQIEERLQSALGTRVKIKPAGDKGKIEIDYFGDEDLQRIIETILPGEEF